MLDGQFLLKVVAAVLAAVGVEEFLKNFIKPKHMVWYAVLMVPLSVRCYMSVDLLPLWVIGSLLTIDSVQLCYQTLIQGFKAIVSNVTSRVAAAEIPGGAKDE